MVGRACRAAQPDPTHAVSPPAYRNTACAWHLALCGPDRAWGPPCPIALPYAQGAAAVVVVALQQSCQAGGGGARRVAWDLLLLPLLLLSPLQQTPAAHTSHTTTSSSACGARGAPGARPG